MTNQIVTCPHCGYPVMAQVRASEQRAGTKRRRLKTRSRQSPANVTTFETSAAAIAPNGWRPAPIGRKSDPIDQSPLSPGESRSSTVFHQWSLGDIATSVALAGVSGLLAGISSVPICIAAHAKWYWPLIIWTGTTTIVWAVKAVDFFDNDKAVVSSQEQERTAEPAPIVQEPPSAEIVINDGKTQKRAKLKAPKSNHAGLWQYADALVRKTAAPSYEGGKEVLGAKAYGYTPAEFGGRSDCWRPTAIAGGILEKDPHKSKGYRLTGPGRRALAVIVKQRLGEWG